jgi:uncharacterized protein YbbC (DUF1343 family)
MKKISVGLDVFRDEYWQRFKGQRLGLLSNQASLDHRLKPARQVVSECLPGRLKALFGPQHGHGGAEQDNMVETGHSHDGDLDIPVFSLYSNTREPIQEMLSRIDTLLIDLQDVGTRVYTFSSTMLNCLRAAAAFGKKVVILDRPNPLGGEIMEGGLLKEELYSFVGPCAIPMRHGLTMAELGRMFHSIFSLDCSLETIPMRGWHRRMLWPSTGRRWAMPSPNMPTFQTACVYPGQVLWEGTHVSEARGTCRPFEMFGAPYLDLRAIRARLPPLAFRGCHLQETVFRPMFHKWREESCRGFMIYVLNQNRFRPYFTSLALLEAILGIHGDRFAWRSPPYEYEFERMPIDLILGDRSLREDLERGVDLEGMQAGWDRDIRMFSEWREKFLIYRS